MKKILLIRLSSLGDVIFNLPLANVLKKNGYEVTWIVSEKGIDVVKNNPAVDKAILLPVKKWKQNGRSLGNFREFLQIIKDLRSTEYDIAIDTQMMFKSMVLMRLCRAKRKICYKKGNELSFLGGNERIDAKPNTDYSIHSVFCHMRYAEYLGLDGTDEVKFSLPQPTDETKAYVDELLSGLDKSKPMVVIAPATTWKLKHWNKDNWKEVAEALKDKCSLVFTGTDADKDLISYISGDKYLSLAGKTKVSDLIEIFSRAKLVIAPDSGSAHLARATEKPAVISIFCCTPAKFFGPFGDDDKYFAIDGSLPCQPCLKKKCNLKGENFERCVNYPQAQKIIDIANRVLGL